MHADAMMDACRRILRGGNRMRLFHIRKIFVLAVLTALAAGGTAVALDGPALAAPVGDRLASGEVLAPGDSLESVSGTYRLLMQTDGNLVEYGPAGQVIWQTSTRRRGASLLNAPDGNLVIQTRDGCVVWSTDYDPTRGPATLSITDTGNLIDQADSGSVLWVIYATPGSPLTRADGAAEFALEQRGKPYVWGTTGPASYDNSGLALASYAVVGISLPHSAPGQLAATTPIDRSQLHAGDLVFYSSGNLVAVYVGNDDVVFVAVTGTVVHLASIDFSPTYAFGRVV
jgi:cell wall-associated NlpC family hydrolase